jgi:hypothetical protein
MLMMMMMMMMMVVGLRCVIFMDMAQDRFAWQIVVYMEMSLLTPQKVENLWPAERLLAS